jgi:mRNA-degrading endonuclease toxin of MazEF toxin-antitoxin module
VINAGDIRLADLNDERRWRVLVVSNARFHRVSARALVAPEVPGEPDGVPFPWRVLIGDGVYAVDLLRSVSLDRLLDLTDRAPSAAMTTVRRALLHIS